MIHALMEFDFVYAIGSFALVEGLNMPEIEKETCLSFDDGRHLFLDKPDLSELFLG